MARQIGRLTMAMGVALAGVTACVDVGEPDGGDLDVTQQSIIGGTQSTWNSGVVGLKVTYAGGAISSIGVIIQS